MDALEDELDNDYERQRWEDFIDRYYCDDCTLERLMQDFNSSACRYLLPINMKPKRMKRLMVRLYREKEPSLCEAACRLVDTRDLLRKDILEPDQPTKK